MTHRFNRFDWSAATACWCAAFLAHGQGAADKTLYRENFRGSLSHWSIEAAKPGRVAASAGVLDIDVPAGCTVWFRQSLSGAIAIEYQALMVSEGGPNDRVSDLNAFWMASDPRSPEAFFAAGRSGAFADYDVLRTYYVGQGGNSNTTTRFRRYIGKAGDRPLLPEHDLREADALLRPNVWQRIRLIADGPEIGYERDGVRIFHFLDVAPYRRGYFGFRTTASHIRVRGFRVIRIR